MRMRQARHQGQHDPRQDASSEQDNVPEVQGDETGPAERTGLEP